MYVGLRSRDETTRIVTANFIKVKDIFERESKASQKSITMISMASFVKETCAAIIDIKVGGKGMATVIPATVYAAVISSKRVGSHTSLSVKCLVQNV